MTGYLETEVAYWRGRAEAAERRLCEAAQHYPEVPPEPPVGTEYVDADDVVLWRRDADGWRCGYSDCRNCPTDWAEAWDRDISVVRFVKRRLPA